MAGKPRTLLPQLPAVPVGLAPEQAAFFTRVREVLEVLLGRRSGAAFDRALLVRDLDTIGVPPARFARSTRAMFNFSTLQTDERAPNPPTNLVVQRQMASAHLSWTLPDDERLWHVEVWRSLTPDRRDAQRVGVVTKPVDTFRDTAVSTMADAYYWVRSKSYMERYSVWTPPDVQGGAVAPAVFPATINEALTKLFDDTRYGAVHTIIADSFKVALPQEGLAPKPVFAVGSIAGQPAVGLAANMVCDGTIIAQMVEAGTLTGREISARAALRLAEGGVLYAGAGNVLLDTGNVGANHARLLIGPDGAVNEDGSVNQGFDFAQLEDGDLRFYRWLDGAHRLAKNVKNWNHLVAVPNNQWADLGYFRTQPSVLVSPANLQCYSGEHSGQNQFFHLGAQVRKKFGLTDFWEVLPVAQLTLDPAGGSQVVGLAGSSSSDNTTFATGTVHTPANCDGVTVRVRLKSVTPTGTSNTFYAKRIKWRVVVDGAAQPWRSVTIGPTLDSVADAFSLSLSAGTHALAVQAMGELAGGTFTVSAPEKEWTTRTAQVSPGTALSLNGSSSSGPVSTSAGVAMPAVSTSGWNVHSVDYTWNFSGQVDVTQAMVDGDGASVIAEVRLSGVGQWYTTFGGGSTSVSRSENDGAGSVLSSSSFELAFTSLTNCAASASLTLTSVTVSATLWRYATNPSGITNEIQFDAFDFHLASATVLASGDVNIIAIGE
ncbi:hypothetical protein JCM16814_34120 [Desulfobaculum senezii]